MSRATSTEPPETPLVVYGSTASYYTGKLEAYLRAKGIAYRLEPFSPSSMARCARHTGARQIPQVECPDGSWLVDTTRILAHFELTRPEPAVSPREPAVAFVSLLLEDYADEWLWRPAMHYRWSYPENARLMGAWLAEHVRERRVPEFMRRRFWRTRQLRIFVRGDGVDEHTRPAVEATYLETLDALEAIFAARPYVLGERPTEADFGFFASMFRHFCCDPAPGRIMRERAPAVHEWVARLWNGRPERCAGAPLPESLPADIAPLLHAVAGVYLPYLQANADAYARGDERVRYEVQGVRFDEPVKPYRVWCRDQLVQRFGELEPAPRAEVDRALGSGPATKLLTKPSAKPVRDVTGPLPIPPDVRHEPLDSWWRGA